MAYTIIPITQRPDGSLSINLRNIHIRQGDYDLYQLSYTSNTDYSGYEPAVKIEVAFRRKDGQQTGWLPLTNIAKQTYKLDLKSRWFTNIAGNLYMTFRAKQVSASNVDLILHTNSITLPIEPTAQFNPVEDLLPSSADWIIQDYTSQLISVRGRLTDLENNKLDSDFSTYSEDAELSGREVIAINDTDGSVKTIKSSLLINNVETVNNILPDANKNITITGSDIPSIDGLTVTEWLSQIGEAFQYVVIHSNNKLYDVDENVIQPETTAVNVSTTTSNVQDELNTINEKIRHVSKFKGVYKTEEQLYTAYPNGVQYEDGIYVILTSTDTVWIYDNDTLQWVNSGSSIGSVVSVNSQLPDNTGNILITGSDINSTVGLNGEATTKSVTQHLQDLYNSNKTTNEQLSAEITNRTNADTQLNSKIEANTSNITSLSNRVTETESDILSITSSLYNDYVNIASEQTIIGKKVFMDAIVLAKFGVNMPYTISNTGDGISIDRMDIKNLLNINETLETVSAFGRNLVFEDDISSPITKTSELENDGDGTSPFATEQYVAENGGKIDSISVNGVTQTIVNKNVNIDVPTDYVTETEFNNQVNVLNTSINSKQSALSTIQLEAVNSGITQSLVSQITTNLASINSINSKIPTQASSTNQLADKDFVNSSLNSITAFYITSTADGDPFATKSALTGATTYYSGGQVTSPTRNDYAIVLQDETKDNATTRYIYYNQWEYQYTVNETSLTAAQLAAINSGITSALVAQITTNSTNISNKAEQSSLNTTNQNLTNLTARVDDAEEDIANNMADIATNTQSISTIEGNIANLQSNKANISDLENYLPLTAGSGKKLTGNLYLTKDTVISNLIHIRGLDSSGNAKSLIALSNTNNVWINYDNSGATIVGGSSLQPFTANHKKTNLGTATASFNNIYGTTIYQDGKRVANAEDIPTILVGGTSSSNATDLVSLGYGYYTWKNNSYIKIVNNTYLNNYGEDIPIQFNHVGSYYTIIAEYNFNVNFKTNLTVNSFSESSGAFYEAHAFTQGNVNGSSTAKNIYAPTSSGTSGQVLKSAGLGNSPTWANIPNFVTLTQAEYDALATKDANTYYFIKEE